MTSTPTSRPARLLRQPEPIVLIGALVIVLGVLAFAKIADELTERDTRKFDERVLAALRHPDNPARLIGPQWIGPAVRNISGLGAPSVLLLVVAAVAGFLLVARNRRTMWLVLLASISGAVAMATLKAAFARPRPEVVPHLDTVASFSFPSGHSMLAAIVYLTLGALIAATLRRQGLKVYVLAVAVLVTLLVGASRVALGVHYPTDVLAGWAAGLAWAFLWLLIGRFLSRKRSTPPSDESDAPVTV